MTSPGVLMRRRVDRRQWLVLAAWVVGSACTSEPSSLVRSPVATSSTMAASVARAVVDDRPLVVERRPMTEAEARQLRGSQDGLSLDCQQSRMGWDWGEIGDDPDELTGRTADDALLDAARSPALPFSGWVSLTRDDRPPVYVNPGTNWRAVVFVGGDEDQGVWRQNEAIYCVDHPPASGDD